MVGGKTLVIIQVRTALIITSDKACTTLVGGGLIFHFGGSLVRFLQTRWLTRSRDGEDKSGFHPEGIILGGEAPGNGCGFIYFSIQLSKILGGGGGSFPPAPPSG